MPTLTRSLRTTYQRLFDLARILPQHAKAVELWCDKVLAQKARYEAIGTPLGVPWFFIAAVHMRESNLNFKTHLHNGDPLTARTVRVPAGRPKAGDPPFTFEASAEDALRLKKLHQRKDWSLPALLYTLEAYNGWGYHYRNMPSPYLWSFTEHYKAGKFIKDGVFDPQTIDQQCGAATLLRRLAERQEIVFADEPALDGPPQVVHYAASRPTDPDILSAAKRLQEWLSSHPGITLKVDGWPGLRTSNAYRAVTGHYLPGDPRA
jgi:lysozyme family protein